MRLGTHLLRMVMDFRLKSLKPLAQKTAGKIAGLSKAVHEGDWTNAVEKIRPS